MSPRWNPSHDVVELSGLIVAAKAKLALCHFQHIAHMGACGKTRVVPQNRRPDNGITEE